MSVGQSTAALCAVQSQNDSEYRLPRSIERRLKIVFEGYPNFRDIVVMATFFGRYQGSAKNLDREFPADWRKLLAHPDLDIWTEWRVKRALKDLRGRGFLQVVEPPKFVRGWRRNWRVGDDGRRWRKALIYVFGATWWSDFACACGKLRRKVVKVVERVRELVVGTSHKQSVSGSLGTYGREVEEVKKVAAEGRRFEPVDPLKITYDLPNDERIRVLRQSGLRF